MSDFSLTGKTAIITGAASGIGFATVKAFIRGGIRGVLLVDLNGSALEESMSKLSKDDQQCCRIYQSDVTQEAFVEAYVAEAMKLWGTLDISVQNAGVASPHCSIMDTDSSVWNKTMDVNGLGVFLGIKHSARAMMKNPSGPKGSIVVIASQLGLQGAPGLSIYSASKFAARGLALSAAEELTPLGLRVNVICPGPIKTPLLYGFDKTKLPEIASQCLMNRLGEPEEIANAVVYLASDASRYCSGTTLKVDGGYAKFG